MLLSHNSRSPAPRRGCATLCQISDVSTPKVLRLHSTVSDRVMDELSHILERCNIRIIAERPGSFHRQMLSFMHTVKAPSFSNSQISSSPTYIDGPRSFTLIDVMIFDPAAPSYVDSSATSAQHCHRALEAAGPRDYFGLRRRPPPGTRMRICTLVVSSFGSLGPGSPSPSPD